MNEWEWQLLEDKTVVDRVVISGVELRPGHRVRLLPRKGGDILDIALEGQIATIESIEQDYEGEAHLSVVLEDDPGRDLGILRQPGHRFFFNLSEVEPISPEEQRRREPVATPSILVAGIGNIFHGDDGFGVEVAQQLSRSGLPPDVRVKDFGIRGLDLMYALQDGYETVILLDAYPHGQTPGTVSVVEPDLSALVGSHSERGFLEPHAMNPINVLRIATGMQVSLNRVLLVGCEPATLGGEEGVMGLSAPVKAAVSEAMKVVLNLVEKMLHKR